MWFFCIVKHDTTVLPTSQAAEIGSRSPRLFYLAATALEASDPLGVLLPEFVLCATLIHLEDPQLLSRIPMTPLTVWLHSVDNFNRLAPGLEKEDADDMLWPGMNKYHRTATGGAQTLNTEMGGKGWVYTISRDHASQFCIDSVHISPSWTGITMANCYCLTKMPKILKMI